MKNSNKRFLLAVLCLFLILSFASCELFGNKETTVACDHEWSVKVTGGKVDYCDKSNPDVKESCHIVKTCSLCGKQEAFDRNPTKQLVYENKDIDEDSVKEVCVGFESGTIDEIVYIPAKVVLSGDTESAVASINTFNNAAISKVYVADGVKTIGGSAFGSCEYLEEVYLPDSVNKILDSCFSECHVLSMIQLPDN